MTIVPIVAAVWLVMAPFILDFGTFALWSSMIAGILAAGLTVLGGLGNQRFYGVVAVGAYLIVSAFFLSGAALWSGLIAGAVLAVAGVIASQQQEVTSTRAGA